MADIMPVCNKIIIIFFFFENWLIPAERSARSTFRTIITTTTTSDTNTIIRYFSNFATVPTVSVLLA